MIFLIENGMMYTCDVSRIGTDQDVISYSLASSGRSLADDLQLTWMSIACETDISIQASPLFAARAVAHLL